MPVSERHRSYAVQIFNKAEKLISQVRLKKSRPIAAAIEKSMFPIPPEELLDADELFEVRQCAGT
jgi:hypothetical protein